MLCLASNVVCFRCFGFAFLGFVSCMHYVFCRDCCFNMDLVFDRAMMMMGRMFPNIYACLLVSFFPQFWLSLCHSVLTGFENSFVSLVTDAELLKSMFVLMGSGFEEG